MTTSLRAKGPFLVSCVLAGVAGFLVRGALPRAGTSAADCPDDAEPTAPAPAAAGATTPDDGRAEEARRALGALAAAQRAPRLDIGDAFLRVKLRDPDRGLATEKTIEWALRRALLADAGHCLPETRPPRRTWLSFIATVRSSPRAAAVQIASPTIKAGPPVPDPTLACLGRALAGSRTVDAPEGQKLLDGYEGDIEIILDLPVRPQPAERR